MSQFTKRKLDLKFWLTSGLLLALGCFFRFAIRGHGFLGFLCVCLAALLCCYKLVSLLARKYPTAGKVLRNILNGCVCIGLVIVVVTGLFVGRACFGDPDGQCEYVVVLGAGVYGSTPSPSLLERIDSAYDYLTDHPQVICVLSGGKGNGEDISEAQCMYRELTARGIDPARLWLEEQSTSTEENLKFSLDLIQARTGIRPEKIGLVSSSYHLFRAGLFARDAGAAAIGIPAETAQPTRFLNYFLREIAGVWHYIVFGG